MSEFLAMGGYGFYVWGAYGVTAVVIALEIGALRTRRQRAYAEAQVTSEPGPAGRTAEATP